MSHVYSSAKELGKTVCHTCGRVHDKTVHQCNRCGTILHNRKHDSIQRCLAYCIASIIVFIPANLWPILIVNELGSNQPTTIIEGVIEFWESEVYTVSIIIFTASILIPGLKLVALFSLCAIAKGWLNINAHTATKIYQITELIGKWSFLDVFVVAILVGLIQLGNITAISAGPAAFAFGLMVLLTMLAAHSFDPRIIWDQARTQRKN